MPENYLDTPATERGDVSLAQVPSLDFSIVQPFASPSKNLAEDLRNKMRGRRANEQAPTRTPRIRNALISRPNPGGPAKQEFTPLLRSAKRKELLRQSIIEEKENAIGSNAPPTPAGFRSSYGDGTQLPLNSSMIDGENTTDSLAGAHIPHPVSSSMLSATPVPTLPRNGQVLDQGNVLSLRDQEAKLDHIQKENFGLKLKIHFLEEALRKTGTEYHQATLKENAELKTERLTIDADTKRQRKRLLAVEQELEEVRTRYTEQLQTSKTHRTSSDAHASDNVQLQKLADEAQRLADQRLREVEDLRAQLDEAQHQDDQADVLQELKDDIDDLNRTLRDREGQLDAKNDEIETLRAELQSAKSGSHDDLEHMQQDIDDLEAEIKEKEEELEARDEKIHDLQDRIRGAATDEDAVAQLRADVADLQSELERRSDAFEKAENHIAQLKERLSVTEEAKQQQADDKKEEIQHIRLQLDNAQSGQAELKQKDDALRNIKRELADREGDIRALQERLNTARGSWDAEAQQTDARLQEKDRIIREREASIRDKTQTIEQRNEELEDLQRRLRTAESRQSDTSHSQAARIKSLSEQVFELERTIQSKDNQARDRALEKDKIIEARSAELRRVQSQVSTSRVDDNALRTKNERIQDLEELVGRLESTKREQAKKLGSMEGRLEAMETPSKKNALIREQSNEVQALRRQLQDLERTKKAEVDDLERELEQIEKKNLELQAAALRATNLQSQIDALSIEKDILQRKNDRLNDKARAAEKDQSILGHQTDELSVKQARIESLEDEIDKLEAACRQHEAQILCQVETMRKELEADHLKTTQALEDDIAMLENALDEADAEKDTAATRIIELEEQVRAMKENSSPVRERRDLKSKVKDLEAGRQALQTKIAALELDNVDVNKVKAELQSAQRKSTLLEQRINELQAALAVAQEEKTIADERQDLHELVKRSQIEAEQLQAKLNNQDRKVSSSSKREGELRGQLEAAQLDIDDLQAHIAELEAKASSSTAREKKLRAQVKECKASARSLEELEMQLGDRDSSSSGHARREAELRTQLRDAKIGLESLQIELAEKEDRILTLMKRENALRQRLKRGRTNDDEATHVLVEDVQAQLDEAEGDVRLLQRQLTEREKLLASAQKKEVDLRSRIKDLQLLLQHNGAGTQLRHQSEVKGLAKQIQFLQAKCTREEGFRQALVFVKRWFFMQVEMYNECNQADLRLLEEMGITPDQTIRQRKPSLRALGLTVMATIRMRKMSAAWAENIKMQNSLIRKMEHMKTARKVKP